MRPQAEGDVGGAQIEAEVEYSSVTEDGLLREFMFKGFREDLQTAAAPAAHRACVGRMATTRCMRSGSQRLAAADIERYVIADPARRAGQGGLPPREKRG